MSSFNRAKVIGYMAALFVAGAATGSLVTWQVAQRTLGAPRPAPEIAKMLWDRLDGVHPTDDQRQKMEPLVQEAARKMQLLRVDSINRFTKAREELNKQLEPLLSEGQRKTLAEIELKHQEEINQKYNISPAKPEDKGAAKGNDQ